MNRLKRAILESAIGDPSFSEPGAAVRTYRFEPWFLGFLGHFPGYPVLPAMVQVLAGVTVAEALLERRLELKGLENAKFHIEIEPGDEVLIRCQERESGGRSVIETRLEVARGLASSFRLTFVEGRAAPVTTP